MVQNKKLPAAGLLIAGIAAFAYYKYSQMSETEKNNLFSDLKEKGRKLMEDYLPENLKSMFPNNEAKTGTDNFGGSTYAGQ